MADIIAFPGVTIDRQIEITTDMFGYGVRVNPDPGNVLRNGAVGHVDYPRALAHARLIRLQYGWPIVDRTGPNGPRAA